MQHYYLPEKILYLSLLYSNGSKCVARNNSWFLQGGAERLYLVGSLGVFCV